MFCVGSVLWGGRCPLCSPATPGPGYGMRACLRPHPRLLGSGSGCSHGHAGSCGREARASKLGPRPPASCPVQCLNTWGARAVSIPASPPPSPQLWPWPCPGPLQGLWELGLQGAAAVSLKVGPAALCSGHDVWAGETIAVSQADTRIWADPETRGPREGPWLVPGFPQSCDPDHSVASSVGSSSLRPTLDQAACRLRMGLSPG